jgi:hypothetical protein
MVHRLFAVALIGIALFGTTFIAASDTSSTASVAIAYLSK